jgi:hypothetical protein
MAAEGEGVKGSHDLCTHPSLPFSYPPFPKRVPRLHTTTDRSSSNPRTRGVSVLMECDLAWPYMCIKSWATHSKSYRTPPVTNPKVDMFKCSRTLRKTPRGFSRSSATHKLISFLPLFSPALTYSITRTSFLPVDLATLPWMQVSVRSVVLLLRHRTAPVILHN